MKTKATIYSQRNEPTIYSIAPQGCFFSPFRLSIDKMENLLLVNFEKDPDKYYNVFELQQAEDAYHNMKLLVIAYRHDGKVDIYHQPGYPFGSQSVILNDVSFFENSMEGAQFKPDAENIDVKFTFKDRYERQVEVQVIERNRAKKKPFCLLAPIGVVAKKPSVLPIYLLHEMSFVKRKHTSISIKIANRSHKPDNFFLPIDWALNYFTRYSLDTFNVDWNKNFAGVLKALLPNQQNIVFDEGTVYEVADNNGYFEIERIKTQNSKHEITISFSPPIADIVCLKDLTEINGTFKISTDNSKGFIIGKYLLKRKSEQIVMQLHPNGGWQPNESRRILRLLYQIVKIFRTWPAAYVWDANISLENPHKPFMQSEWNRI